MNFLKHTVLSCFLLSSFVVNSEDYWIKHNVAKLEELKKEALSSELSYDLVESLTTEVGARFTGTPNSEKAVHWAMNKMRNLGFDKVWQEHTFTPKWKRGKTIVKVTAPYEHELTSISLGGNIGTDGKALVGNIAHFKSLKELQTAKPKDLRDKIVFISYKVKRTKDGSGYYPGANIRFYGPSLAAKLGATGFIMRSVGTSQDRFAHTGMTKNEIGIKPIPSVAISNPDADLLLNILKRTEEVELSLYSSDEFESTEQSKVTNVIGELTGKEKKDELIVLAAHLDSWDVGTGAIDDGVGVGMVLAAAHFNKYLKDPPKRTIRVILYGGEEIGFVGAKSYVKRHKSRILNHQIAVEWDYGNNYIEEIQPGVGENAFHSIKQFVDYLEPMGVRLLTENNAKGQSDISLLGALGVPAINVIPDGTDYLDYHHNENDTFDKVKKESLIQNTAIFAMFAFYASNSDVDFRK